MRSGFHRILSFILAVAMLLGMCPQMCFVHAEATESGSTLDPLYQEIPVLPGQLIGDTGEIVDNEIYGYVVGYELKKGHSLSISNADYVFSVRQLIDGNYSTMLKQATADSFTATEDMTVGMLIRKPDKSALTAEELANIVIYDSQYGMVGVDGYAQRFYVDAETIDGDVASTRCNIFLPENYSETGTPTKLIVMTNGHSAYLTDSTWNGNTADNVGIIRNYLNAGYAVWVVNNTKNHTGKTPDLGCPQLVDSYFKAYEYIQEHFNVEEKFSIHSRSFGTFAAVRIMLEHPELVKCAVMTGARVSITKEWPGLDKAFIAGRFGFSDTTGNTYEADVMVGHDPYTDVDGENYALPPTFWMLAEGDATTKPQEYIEKLSLHGNDVSTKIYSGIDHTGICTLNTEETFADALEFLSSYQTEESHTHVYDYVVTSPTCTEQGYTTYTCACGESFVDDYVDASEHSYENGACKTCAKEDTTVELFKRFSTTDFFLKSGVLSDGKEHVVAIYSNTNNARMVVIPIQDGATYYIRVKNNGAAATNRMKICTFAESFDSMTISPLASERNMSALDPEVVSIAQDIVFWDPNIGADCVSEYEGVFVNTGNAKTLVLFTAWGADPSLVEVSVKGENHIPESDPLDNMDEMISILIQNMDQENQATKDILKIAQVFWEHRDEFIYCSGTALDQPWNYWSYTGYVDSANTGKTVTAENAGYKRIDCSTFVRYVVNGIDYYSTPYYNALELTQVEQGGLEDGAEVANNDLTVCRTGEMSVRPGKKLILEAKDSNYSFTKIFGYDASGNVIQTLENTTTGTVFVPDDGVVYIRAEMKTTAASDYAAAKAGVPAAILKCLRIREDERLEINAECPLSGYRNANQMCKWFDQNGYAVEIDQDSFDPDDLRIGTVIFWGRTSGTWAYKNITHTSIYIGDGYVMHVSAPYGLLGGEGILIEPIATLMERYDIPLVAASSPKYHKAESHAHSYTESVTAPTCSEQGYTTYTCECGESYVDDSVDATGHSYAGGSCTACGEKAPELAGKTLSILGASISTYGGTSNGDAADTTNSTIRNNAQYYPHSVVTDVKLNDTWWMQAAEDLGLRLLVNNAWSGSSLLYDRNGTAGAYVDRCVQLHDDTGDNAGEVPDIIGIQMGTNDFQYYKDTLGTADIDYAALITDNGDGSYTYAEPVTSLEAAAIVLHKISVRYPNAEVYYLNISQRVDNTDELIRTFNADLKQVVEHFGAHIVDIYGSAITMEDFDTYIGDGRVHPNKLGMDVYTEAFKAAVLANTAYSVEAHTVSFDLTNATADYGTDKAVVSGDGFSVNLTAAAGMELSVTVTMDGEDITDLSWKEGAVTIEAVTGDVVITAVGAPHEPRTYRWEFDGSDLVCVSGGNALTKNSGTTTDGVFSKTRYALDTGVVLLHDQPWIVEWKCEGTFLNAGGSSGARVFTSTDVNGEYNARYIFKSNTNGIIAMGEKTTSGSHNYGLALKDHGVDWTALHTYRLENRIAEDGSNMVWLSVDGKEIGPLNNYYVGTTNKNTTSDWLNGKDFIFPYMGTDTHGFTNAKIEYVQVWESHTHSYEAAVTAPTCTEKGCTSYTCECGDIYVDDYVEASGHQRSNIICVVCGDTFEGKTVSILSASTSTYAGISNNVNSNSTIGNNAVYYTEGKHGVDLEDTWWQQAVDALGMRLLVNNSWSGSCVYQARQGAASVGYGSRAVNLHNDHTGEEPDVIWVYLGGNDFAYYKDTFGIAADVDYSALIMDNADGTFTYASPQTTCEAYAIMLHKIVNRYSDAEVYCMTSIARRDPDYADDNKPDAGQPTLYNAELVKVAEHMGFPVIDIENVIPKEAEIFDKYIGDKRAHPNALGMDLLTNKVISVMLGREAEICHVTSKDGTVTEQAVLLGGSYRTDVVIQDGYSVVVTMGSKDITAEAYRDGRVTIGEVTGDISITSIIKREPLHFSWRQTDNELVSVGNNENSLKILGGSIIDGVFNGVNYQLATPVILKHDFPWVLEWKCAGDWRASVFSADATPQTKGSVYLSRTKGGQLCFGSWTGTQYDNYGVDISNLDEQMHLYRLENQITADGSNMVWLYVDGSEIGPMNNYYVGSSSQSKTSDWICGKDFTFRFIGTTSNPINNCKLEYLTVWEGGHSHVYDSVITVPTCTEQGYTTHTCTTCGDSYADTYVGALEHAFGSKPSGEIRYEATCTTAAVYYVQCDRCDAVSERLTVPSGDPLGHDAVSHDGKVATCTQPGWNAYETCSRCDYTTYTEIPATGHAYESVVTAPTCTEQGYTTHTCTCGDSYVDTYVEPNGHSYGNWIEIKAPTCTEKGTEQHCCANCDAFETREIDATGHSYESVVTVPTCTQKGYTTHTCHCGDSYVDTYLDALGHSYSGITCTVCDAEHPEAADYSGKVISILSASTSTFAGYIPVEDGFNLEHRPRYPQDNLLTDVNETWWMQVINDLDAKLGINDSWAGSTVSNFIDGNSGDVGENAAMASLTRIQNLGSNGTPDVILFYGGGNDMGRGVTLGSFDPETAPVQVDLTATKWDSFADAYVAAIMRLQHFYPDTEIVVIMSHEMPSYVTAAKLDKYGPVIKAICEHYGVKYVDLRDCGTTFDMLPDGIHPNAEGMDYITADVLQTLLNDVEMEAGENVVYTVTHDLTNAGASLHYYNGVSEGTSFVETITGEGVTVTVTMGGADITDSIYAEGTITIPEVTGDLVITAKGSFNADGHLQQLPEDLCAGTNLWTALEPENIYYTASGWGNTTAGTTWSITFPVEEGDRIWATSLGAYPDNGSSANGVRVTWFDESGVLVSLDRSTVYAEFAEYGYITAPEGAVALNLPMTNNQEHYAVYILSAEHSYESAVTAPTCTEQGYTTYTCACGESYVDDHVDASGHTWTSWQQIAEMNCQGQGRWMRSCETCAAEQYTTDQDGSCVSFNSPAILANAGDTVVLTYYDVAFDADTVTDAASIAWSSDQLIIDQGCVTPEEPGVYRLTATSGTVSKTVYLVVKAPEDTEYVLYFDDFNDATLSGYRPIEVSSGAQYYVSDGKLILDAVNSAQSYIRILLPEWIGDFGDYEISTTFTMTEALDSTKWFAVMARVQDEDYPYWQAAVRYYATASDGIVIDERTKASGLNNGWNITHTGAYTENISASKYYLQTFGLNGSYGYTAINGTTLLESDTMTLGPGDVGFQIRGAVASIDSIKIVIPVDTAAHTFGEWTVTTAPTCTEPGTETRSCSVCGCTETRDVAPSHDLVQHEEKMHTCTESGWLAYETCTRCDYSTLVEVSPTGHSYQRQIHSVAHRGYSQTAPENTLASYELAKQLGYFYVECDVSFTADGIPVLLHDDTIDRTSDGTGKISELTYEQLLQYDFGSWKSADYAGTSIPTFEEFIALCAELDLHPYIELKSSGKYTQEKVRQLVDIVDAYGMTGKVTWISYSNTFLGYVKNADPTARLGYIYSGDATESVINTAKMLQTDQNEVFLFLNYSKITNTGILRAATNGFAIEVWTVNSESAILALPSYVSGVISDKLNAQSILVDSGITITAPTCTEQGYTTYTCHCGDSYVDTYVDALGHSFNEWMQTKAPSCTEEGAERRDCDRCDHFETQAIVELGHELIQHGAKTPTCTEIGWNVFETCSRCNYSTYAEISATGHSYEAVVTAPTCTERGYTTHTCHCSDSYVDTYVDALGHSFSEWTQTKAPSCTEKGEERRDCDRCDHFETQTVEALGHDLTQYDAKDATCTEIGWNTYEICSRCDYSTYVEIPATGHSYESITTAPTCTEQGYTTHTCHCSDSYVDTYVDALGHSFGDWTITTDPTCTEEGEKRRDCDRCDHFETQAIAELGHDLVKHDAKDATCTEIGWNAYETCSRCDYSTYVEIPATGHSYESIATAPTCTEQGYTTHTCHCGDSYVDSYVDAHGHSFGDWTQTKVPTCTEKGAERRDCDRCDHFETQAIAELGHDLVKHDAKDATCTEIGWNAYETCSRCDYSTYAEIPATGHSYEAVVTAPNCTEQGYTTHSCHCGDSYMDSYVNALGHSFGDWTFTTDPTCAEVGEKRRDCDRCDHFEMQAIDPLGHDLTQHYAKNPTCTEIGWNAYETCSRCDYSTYAEIPATGHSYETVVTDPTCTEQGYTTHTCHCGDSYVDSYVDALGHSFVDWTITTDPTCTEAGEERRDCDRCDHFETRVVDALGHAPADAVEENRKEATCTEDGSYESVVYCSVCKVELSHNTIVIEAKGHTKGDSVIENKIEVSCIVDGTHDDVIYCVDCDIELSRTNVIDTKAPGHSFGEWTATKAATCTEKGIEQRDCVNCDYFETREIAALGHAPAAAVDENRVEATCTEDGSYESVVYCSVCSAELSRETVVLSAKGHAAGEVVIENMVDASCTENGSYDNVTYCAVCNAELSRVTAVIPAKGHTEGAVIVENEVNVTCTVDGTHDDVIYCVDCDIELSRNEVLDVHALGHSFSDWTQTKAPNCSDKGEDRRECENCDHFETRVVDALGHAPADAVEENRIEATCLEDGSYESVVYCSVCKVELSRNTIVIDAKGHTASEVVVENKVDVRCTVDGTHDNVIYCMDCDVELSRTPVLDAEAIGHSFGEWTQTKAPSCTEKGIERRDCNRCDHFETQAIDALSHDLVQHDAKDATCAEIGWNTYETCSRCDYNTYAEIPATGHSYDAVVTAPTCTEQGYTTHTCHCGDSYVDTYVDALGHSFSEWMQSKAPSCTEKGDERRDCNRCDHFETQAIAELGHDLVPHNAKDATCTEIGWDTYNTCSRCDYSSYAEIPATGHNYEAVITAPTCTEQGYTTHACHCGESHMDSYVNALGHDFGDWTATKAPSCTEKGEKRRDCDRCDHFEKQAIDALDHDLVKHGAKDATCTEIGWNAYETCSRCDYSTYVEIPATGHSFEAAVTAPTCTEQGYTTHSCQCGDSYVDSYVDALDHDFGDWTQTKASICTEKGEERRDCDRCDHFEIQAIVELGHDRIQHGAKTPTCTEIGWNAYDTCSRCDYSTYVEIPATGHSYEAAVIAPTCTEQGYTTHTCHCGDSYVDTYVDALGHSFSEWTQTKAPTCTEEGTERRDCDRCDYFETDVVDALGHDLVQHNAKTPTCTEIGWNAYDTCSRCDYSTYVEIPATGHSYEAVVTAPTCTEQGYTTHTCHCGDNYVDSYVDALDHDFGEWTQTKAPSCTEKGEERRDCDRCDHFETQAIAELGHNLVQHEAKDATCTDIGWNFYETCSRCDYSTYVEIPATGHSYEFVVVEPTCTEQGYTTHACHCGDSYVDSYVDALGHSFGDWTITTDPICTEVGEERRDCDRCDHFETSVVNALGHNSSEAVEENHKEATCTENGSYESVVYCSVCSAELSRETAAIPAIGHTEGAVVVENKVNVTCIVDGTHDDVIYCVDCDIELSRTNIIDAIATGHSFGEWTVTMAPACTEKGIERRNCTNCDHFETREIAALGHSPAEAVEENRKEATCTEDSSYDSVVYCSVCKVELSRDSIVIEAKGHTEGEIVVENNVEVSCTFDGTHDDVIYCVDCDIELSRTNIIDTKTPGHSFGEWTVTKTATCTEKGIEQRDCVKCDHFETREIAAMGHSPADAMEEKRKEATCTEDGSYESVVYCSVCSAELSRETVVLSAKGHAAGEVVIENKVNVTCTVDGTHDDVIYCVDCDIELSRANVVDTKALGHSFGEWYLTTAPICTEKGAERRDCTNCDHFETREIAALGHTPTTAVEENRAEATCNEGGSYDSVVYCAVCKEELSRNSIVIEAKGHTEGDAVIENKVEVSCTIDGTHDDVIYCVDCDIELSRTPVLDAEATGHNFGEWTQTKAPTCTENGEERRDCDRCDHFEIRTVDALGHVSEAAVEENRKNATCTEDGSYESVVYCSVCKVELSRDSVVIEAKGHTEGEIVVENKVEVSCTFNGTHDDVIYCVDCDIELSRTPVLDAETTGHSFGEWTQTKAPSCTEKGEERRDCDRCDHSEMQPINALGHDLVQHDAKDATCTQIGWNAYDTCSHCDYSTYVEIPATGHSYESVVIAPTCTEQGYTTHICHCGDSYVDSYVDALGHSFSEWTQTKAPNCTEKGEEHRDCNRCDHFEMQAIDALSHDLVQHDAKDATCTEIGWYAYDTCTRCDSSTYAEIPATGHSYAAVVTAPTCTDQGYTTHTCHCGDSYVDTYVDALGHRFTEYVSDSNATCTLYGTQTSKCDRCDATDTQIDVGSVLGHDFSEWIETVPATSLSAGEEKRFCQSCGIEQKRSIDKLRNPFIDVEFGAYYEVPVLWAVSKGITNGMTSNTFEPDSKCTRGQVVTFLWRASGEPEPAAKNNPFKDVLETDYFYKAVLWAVEEGITKGVSADQFAPDQSCTRAQVATFLWRAQGEPKAANANHPFTDIKSGDYYFEAVLWAVEAGVTNGMSPTTFAPENTCTRGQIVTFLYRALK